MEKSQVNSKETRVLSKKIKLLGLICIALLGLGCAGYQWVKVEGVTTVQGIELNGLNEIGELDVLSAMGISLQTSWEEVETESLEVLIMKLPLVESVHVEMGFDRVVRVQIVEASVLAASFEKKWCDWYSNGHRICHEDNPMDVPIIQTTHLDSMSQQNLVKYLVDLKENQNAIYQDLAMVSMQAESAHLYFNSHSLKVKVLLGTNTQNQWVKYDYIMKHFTQKINQKHTLDLRFEGYAYAS